MMIIISSVILICLVKENSVEVKPYIYLVNPIQPCLNSYRISKTKKQVETKVSARS